MRFPRELKSGHFTLVHNPADELPRVELVEFARNPARRGRFLIAYGGIVVREGFVPRLGPQGRAASPDFCFRRVNASQRRETFLT